MYGVQYGPNFVLLSIVSVLTFIKSCFHEYEDKLVFHHTIPVNLLTR